MIRGKGKTKGNVKRNEFYKHYKENAKEEIISKSLYSAFIKELLATFSKAIVETGLELQINKVGKLRIRSKKLNFFDKNGELIPFGWIERIANQKMISIRSGCFCNPGIDEVNNCLTTDELSTYFSSRY